MLSKLIERLSKWNVELFYTDNWGVYQETVAEEKLYQSKSQTVYLEQNNGRQRHWFARFRRKSIVVSKTLEMVNLTMALFARFHVNGSWKILRHYLANTLKKKIIRIVILNFRLNFFNTIIFFFTHLSYPLYKILQASYHHFTTISISFS